MQTIFITITRGFIVRNILRSGTLELLVGRGFRVIILFPVKKGGSLPVYLREEFEDGSRVIVEGVEEKPQKRGYSLFSELTMYLVYSRSTWIYELIGNITKLKQPRWYRYLRFCLYYPLQYVPGIKRLARSVEYCYFNTAHYLYLFEKYKPALVFSTSIVSRFDIAIMKEARRQKVKTVSMPKGWDNISKGLYRFVPDHFVVQNELMRDDLILWQGVRPECITVTGFPQFDWYRRHDVIQSRESFLRSLGFDPLDKLIFFGSEGSWLPEDHRIAEHIAHEIGRGRICMQAGLLVRPHFSDIGVPRFDYLKGMSHVTLDPNFNRSDFFIDHWDPTTEETRYFVNLVYHADVLVTLASTLSLDCAAYDTPLINVAYGGLYYRDEDVTHYMYETHHSQWVLKTGAVRLVSSESELTEAINEALLYPEVRREERKKLLDTVCYKVDGNSSQRIVQVIEDVIELK